MRRYVSHILTTGILIMNQSSAGLDTVYLYTALNVLKVIIINRRNIKNDSTCFAKTIVFIPFLTSLIADAQSHLQPS